jgi:SOS response regulatory protein OraA/RecX
MGNDKEISFVCYNCNETNYIDKSDYISKAERSSSAKGHSVKEITVECKSCRELNSVKIEY